jgi:hypothetical protein
MKQVKIASKGYTVKVVSWENDGDNYRTESMTVDTKEEALKIKKICKELFKSGGKFGVGNSMDGEGQPLILAYMKSNPEMELTKGYINKLDQKLMGGSEYYDFRVCESVQVTYLPEDVFAEEI